MKKLIAVFILFGLAACGGSKSPSAPSTPPVAAQPSHEVVEGVVGAYLANAITVQISRAGNGSAVLTWNTSADLDLYLTRSSCTVYPLGNCEILATSAATSGNREQITRSVNTGESYVLWVDNFAGTPQSYRLTVDVN